MTLYCHYDNIITMILKGGKNMDILLRTLPLLIPILVLDIALAVAAIRHILRHPHYRFGNKTMWLIIVIALLLFGPVLYFVLGKEENA